MEAGSSEYEVYGTVAEGRTVLVGTATAARPALVIYKVGTVGGLRPGDVCAQVDGQHLTENDAPR